jgi:hypothetical protein
MSNNTKRIGILILALIVFCTAAIDLPAEKKAKPVRESEKFKIHGGLLGVFYNIAQDDRAAEAPKKNQIDLAGNLDLQWNITTKVRVNIQLWIGPGEGNLGFGSSSATVTDLNVEIDLSDHIRLTVGSYDTPFGVSTLTLTNNGDASASLLILNSLFYSAFAGTPVGTLNTVGIKAEWDSSVAHISAAVTNGTGEAALNPDGNFEFVMTAETKPFLGGLYAAFSYIRSKDFSVSGVSGSESDFTGWLVDLGYHFKEVVLLDGYYGMLTYGDEDSDTEDDVRIWKAQVKLNFDKKKWFLAGRVSGWEPKDDNGNGLAVSPHVPRPGLVNPLDTVIPFTDRKIHRFQVGGGYRFSDHLLFKAEWFYDRYSGSDFQGDADSKGFIAALNVLF